MANPDHTDGLWQHTCFEAFIMGPAGEAYWELNLSPSLQWASYHFDSYRAGMRNATELAPPHIGTWMGAEIFRLSAAIDLGRLPDLRGMAAWRLALSAVIEDVKGGKSWWALSHPPGKPDFHHRDCFALDLPPA
jgi:hypothetical protein